MQRMVKLVVFLVASSWLGSARASVDDDLLAACRHGDLPAVQQLVDAGANLKAVDEGGGGVLFKAAITGKLDLIRYLVEHGADVNAGDRIETPFFKAVLSGNVEAAEYLRRNGAAVDTVTREGTAAFYAAASGKLEMVHYIEKLGLDFKVRNSRGETTLHWAVGWGRLEVVKYLLQTGFDPMVRDSRGDSPLRRASHSAKTKDVVAYLDGLLRKRVEPLLIGQWGDVPPDQDGAGSLLVSLAAGGACRIEQSQGGYTGIWRYEPDWNVVRLQVDHNTGTGNIERGLELLFEVTSVTQSTLVLASKRPEKYPSLGTLYRQPASAGQRGR